MSTDKKYIHPTPIDNSVEDSDNTNEEKTSEDIDSDKNKKLEDELNKERNQGDETVGIP